MDKTITFQHKACSEQNITRKKYKVCALRVLFKVSARVKKGEFSKFLISRCSDKACQELSFKKNSTKKYSFSAKLLDIEVYCTLIALITR